MSPVPEMCLDFHIHTPELFFLNVMQSLKNIPIILLELEGAWERTVTSMLISKGVKEN